MSTTEQIDNYRVVDLFQSHGRHKSLTLGAHVRGLRYLCVCLSLFSPVSFTQCTYIDTFPFNNYIALTIDLGVHVQQGL